MLICKIYFTFSPLFCHKLKLIITMETKLLFPHRFKKVGWLLFGLGLLLTSAGIFGERYYFFEGEHIFSKWTTFDTKLSDIWERDVSISTTKTGIDRKPHQIYQENFGGEIVMTLVLIGFLLVAFSREKREDEYISKIRTESLVWGLYVYFFCLLAVIWLTYSLLFWMAINWIILVPLLVFVVRFHWFVYLKPYFEERKGAAA